MATHPGIIQSSGKSGNPAFCRQYIKYPVQRIPSFNSGQFKNDPTFSRWRANCAEFGRAGKACKLLRTALQDHLRHFGDHTMVTRLSREFLKIIKSDTINIPGLRNPTDGNLNYLTGFDFNSHSPLTSTLYTTIQTRWNRAAGTGTIIPGTFIPAVHLRAPHAASHFLLSAIGVNIDFGRNTHKVAVKSNTHSSCSADQPLSVELITEMTPGNTHPSLLLLGLKFFDLHKEGIVPFRNGAMDVLTIISINTV